MLYGGHVKSLDDIDFLQDMGFDLGEVVLKDEDTRALWSQSGIINQFSSGFFLIAHGPREGPPNDINRLWNNYYPELEKTVAVARHMDIHLLTIHLWMDPRFVKPEARGEKKSILKNLLKCGLENGVSISLENLSECAADLAEVLEAAPNLGLTLDVGHGQLLTEINTSFGIIEELIGSISHVHLHDNCGGRGVKDDLHLPIGDGIIDFPNILKALIEKGYDRTMTLELEKDALASSRQCVRAIVGKIESAQRHPMEDLGTPVESDTWKVKMR